MMSRILQLSNNKKVHYIESGQGEPTVFIHGVGMQALAWQPQLTFFSKNYHVISVDMPGHGKSDGLQEGSTLTDFVTWGIEVIEKLALGPVNLVGHSMGSLITLGVSVTRPDLVKRMAVLNSVYKRSSKEKKAILKRVAELESGYMDTISPIQRWFNGTKNTKLAYKVKSWLEEMKASEYLIAYSAFAHGDNVYADNWKEVRCPSLILTGEQDLNSSADMATQMADNAKFGKAVIIKNEKHMVNLTAPRLVNKAISQWLQTSIH